MISINNNLETNIKNFDKLNLKSEMWYASEATKVL